MKRLTFRTENQWRSLRDGADVDLLRLSLIFDRYRAGFAVTVLGFGVGLTYWHKQPEQATWGDLIGAATGAYVTSVAHGMSTDTVVPVTYSYSWEPIETNGWAGEPQGMEKAP